MVIKHILNEIKTHLPLGRGREPYLSEDKKHGAYLKPFRIFFYGPSENPMAVYSVEGKIRSVDNYNGQGNTLCNNEYPFLFFLGENCDAYVLNPDGVLYRKTLELKEGDKSRIQKHNAHDASGRTKRRIQRIVDAHYERVPQILPLEHFSELTGPIHDTNVLPQKGMSARNKRSVVDAIRSLTEEDLERVGSNYDRRQRRINIDPYGGRATPSELLVGASKDSVYDPSYRHMN